MHFNVFEAAPENLVDGPSHQPPANAPIKVSHFSFVSDISPDEDALSAARVFPVGHH